MYDFTYFVFCLIFCFGNLCLTFMISPYTSLPPLFLMPLCILCHSVKSQIYVQSKYKPPLSDTNFHPNIILEYNPIQNSFYPNFGFSPQILLQQYANKHDIKKDLA